MVNSVIEAGGRRGRVVRQHVLDCGGWKLRWRIMQTERVKERFRRQREMLGLPPKENELVTSDGQAATQQQVAQEMEAFDADLQKGKELEMGEDMEVGEAEPGFMHEQPSKQEKVVL